MDGLGDIYRHPLVDLGQRGHPKLHGIRSPLYPAEIVDRYIHAQFTVNAAEYERNFGNVGRFRHLIGAAFERLGMSEQDRTGLRVLDIGSGAGNSVLPLIELCPGSQLVASDLSVELLARLRDSLAARGLGERCSLLQLNAEELDFLPETFDLVVGAAILHHLLAPEKAIAGCARILKPGGVAMFFEPFEPGTMIVRMGFARVLADARSQELDPRLRRFLEGWIREQDLRRGRDKSDPRYLEIDDKWLFNRSYFQALADEHGFSDCRIHPLHRTDGVAFERYVAYLIGHVGGGEVELPGWAWDVVREPERVFSEDAKLDLLIEGGILLVK